MIHVATLCALAGLFTQQDPAPSTTIRHAEVLPADSVVAVSVADLRDRTAEARAMLRGPAASLLALPQIREVTDPLLGAAAVEFNASSIDVGRWIENGSSLALLPDGGFVAALSTGLPAGHEIPRSIDLVTKDGRTHEVFVGRHDELLVVASDIDVVAQALERIGTMTSGLAGTDEFSAFAETVLLTSASEPLLTVFARPGAQLGTTVPPIGYLLDRVDGKVEEHLFVQLGTERPTFVEKLCADGEALPPMLARFAPSDATAFVATRTDLAGLLQSFGSMTGEAGTGTPLDGLFASVPAQIESLTTEFGALLETFGDQHTVAQTDDGSTLWTVSLTDPAAARTALETMFGDADESGAHPRFTTEESALALVGTRLWTTNGNESLDRFLRDLRPETRHPDLLPAMQDLDARTSALVWLVPDADDLAELGGSVPFAPAMLTRTATGLVQDAGPIRVEVGLDDRGLQLHLHTGAGLLPGAIEAFATSLAEATLISPEPPAGEAMSIEVDSRVETVWIEQLREAERNGARGEDLIPLLTAPSTLVASRAAWLLTEKPYPAAAPALTTLVTHESLEVRRNAVCALCALGKKAPRAAMRKALDDEDPSVRAVAAKHFGRFGKQSDATALLAIATRTPSEGPDRAAAILAIADLGAASDVVRTTVLLTDPSKAEERALTWALQTTSRTLGEEGEVAAMLDVLAHPAMPVRRFAIERLGQLADPTSVDALERRLATEGDSLRPRIEAALVAARGPEFQGANPLVEDEGLLLSLSIGLGVLGLLGIGFTLARRGRSSRQGPTVDASNDEFEDEFGEDFGEEFGEDFEDTSEEVFADDANEDYDEEIDETFAEDTGETLEESAEQVFDDEDAQLEEELGWDDDTPTEVESPSSEDTGDEELDWGEDGSYDESEDSLRS